MSYDSSASMLRDAFARIDGARIEGRQDNIIERKIALLKLYNRLQSSADKIVSILVIGDLSYPLYWIAAKVQLESSRAESDALLELSIVLHTLRQIVDELDLGKSLQTEYLPRLGRGSSEQWRPLGNTLIIGEPRLPISTSIIPLSIAVATGNTTLLILPYKTSSMTKMLEKIIKAALDTEACGLIMVSTPQARLEVVEELLKFGIHNVVGFDEQLFQHIHKMKTCALNTNLLRQVTTPMLAIVTRNACLEIAAKDLFNTVFSWLKGASYTCPSFVLIDEFVLGRFLDILLSLGEEGSNVGARPIQTPNVGQMRALNGVEIFVGNAQFRKVTFLLFGFCG
ncbi:hypothetical protein VE03_06888 [Pseudogymnoascus sp. 23342-1-I1]|nr:hypothetical protein VE03_06888 [Pseudogymnoascus sp. 23342-1-I1]